MVQNGVVSGAGVGQQRHHREVIAASVVVADGGFQGVPVVVVEDVIQPQKREARPVVEGAPHAPALGAKAVGEGSGKAGVVVALVRQVEVAQQDERHIAFSDDARQQVGHLAAAERRVKKLVVHVGVCGVGVIQHEAAEGGGNAHALVAQGRDEPFVLPVSVLGDGVAAVDSLAGKAIWLWVYRPVRVGGGQRRFQRGVGGGVVLLQADDIGIAGQQHGGGLVIGPVVGQQVVGHDAQGGQAFCRGRGPGHEKRPIQHTERRYGRDAPQRAVPRTGEQRQRQQHKGRQQQPLSKGVDEGDERPALPDQPAQPQVEQHAGPVSVDERPQQIERDGSDEGQGGIVVHRGAIVPAGSALMRCPARKAHRLLRRMSATGR